MYYNRLKNSKIVISDFHLAKLENGLIKEPCGTPEYLGEGAGGGGGVPGALCPPGGSFPTIPGAPDGCPLLWRPLLGAPSRSLLLLVGAPWGSLPPWGLLVGYGHCPAPQGPNLGASSGSFLLPITPRTHPGCPHGPLALLPGLCEQPEERIQPQAAKHGEADGCPGLVVLPLGGLQLLGSPGRDPSPRHPPVPRSSGGGGAAAVRAAGGLLGDRRHHVHPVSAGWARGARGRGARGGQGGGR